MTDTEVNLYNIGHDCLSVVISYLDLVSLVTLCLTSRIFDEQVKEQFTMTPTLNNPWEKRKDIFIRASKTHTVVKKLFEDSFKIQNLIDFESEDDRIAFINLQLYDRQSRTHEYISKAFKEEQERKSLQEFWIAL